MLRNTSTSLSPQRQRHHPIHRNRSILFFSLFSPFPPFPLFSFLSSFFLSLFLLSFLSFLSKQPPFSTHLPSFLSPSLSLLFLLSNLFSTNSILNPPQSSDPTSNPTSTHEKRKVFLSLLFFSSFPPLLPLSPHLNSPPLVILFPPSPSSSSFPPTPFPPPLPLPTLSPLFPFP